MATVAALAATALALGPACGGGRGSGVAGGPTDGVEAVTNVAYATSVSLDVFSPDRPRAEADEAAPVIVTLHGCCGGREDLVQLAHGLAAAGAVVFNASYRNLPSGGGFPESYRQAACAVAFARASAAAYGGDPARVTLVGWSDGALVAGAVANGGIQPGDGCASVGQNSVPDALVALGGFLGWDGEAIGAAEVTAGAVRWFGALPDSAPTAWVGGDPHAGLGSNLHLAVRLVVGEDDPLRAGNERYLAAALAAGLDARLVLAEGTVNQTLLAPRTAEGRLAVREILQVARGVSP